MRHFLGACTLVTGLMGTTAAMACTDTTRQEPISAMQTTKSDLEAQGYQVFTTDESLKISPYRCIVINKEDETFWIKFDVGKQDIAQASGANKTGIAYIFAGTNANETLNCTFNPSKGAVFREGEDDQGQRYLTTLVKLANHTVIQKNKGCLVLEF